MLHLHTEAIVAIAIVILFFVLGLIAVAYAMGAFRRQCSWCCCRCWWCCCKAKRTDSQRDFDSLNELLFEVDENETAILNISAVTVDADVDGAHGGGGAAAEPAMREISIDAFFPDILAGKVDKKAKKKEPDVEAAAGDDNNGGLTEPLL